MTAKWFQRKQVLFRAQFKVQRILPYLTPGEHILDIGTGNGGVAYLLSAGYRFPVDAVDIVDKSKFRSIAPRIFDGNSLPFGDNSYPAVLLLTVLHHAADPEQLIREASRVCSDRLIVMEDIYSNGLQKGLTLCMDSIVNWEFAGHPHNNKTDKEWRALFAQLGWGIEAADYHQFAAIFTQATYVLKMKKGRP
jgi:SAM-dependent methyltransferase